MKKLKLLACGAAIAAMIACVSGCTFTIGGKTSYSYKNSDDYVVGDREISDKPRCILGLTGRHFV